jgi:phosphatidylserine decarboxylase
MVSEGYYFGLPPFGAGLLALGMGGRNAIIVGSALVLLALFIFSFFRNPERIVPEGNGLIVSPADGRIVILKEEPFAGRPGKRISIFLAIWNVHVNRSPAAGTITKLEYKPGKFLAAWAESASLENEQNVFNLSTKYGDLQFKQIAGYIARRVVSWKKVGEELERGERIGLMRFGSRMDVWLPDNADVIVKVGDNVKGGSSVLAQMTETAGVRAAGANPTLSPNQKIGDEERLA